MFAKLDTNSDGLLSADEASARSDERMEKMFTRVDTNGDGVLSAEELEAAKEKRKNRKGSKRDRG